MKADQSFSEFITRLLYLVVVLKVYRADEDGRSVPICFARLQRPSTRTGHRFSGKREEKKSAH